MIGTKIQIFRERVFGSGGCNGCISVLITRVCICIPVWYPSRKQKDFDQVMLFMADTDDATSPQASSVRQVLQAVHLI